MNQFSIDWDEEFWHSFKKPEFPKKERKAQPNWSTTTDHFYGLGPKSGNYPHGYSAE